MPPKPNQIGRYAAIIAGWCILALPAGVAADELIYDDTLGSAWSDWSWQTTRTIDKTQVKSGTNALAIQYTAAWAAVSWRRTTPLATTGYTALRFWIYGNTASKELAVRVQTNDTDYSTGSYRFTPKANAWTEITIPLTTLGSPAQIARVNIQDQSGTSAPPPFYVDQLSLLAPSIPTQLTVDTSMNRHPISPYIYGMNSYGAGADASDLWKTLNLPVSRFGGNNVSRYNWKLDATNTGADWYFENVRLSNASNIPADSAANRIVEQNQQRGTQSLVTIPMTGYVAKDSLACGFSISQYGAQPVTDTQWRPNCGNGVSTSGQHITGVNPTDTSMAAPPSFVGEWVTFLKTRYGSGNTTGVRFYALDNEADLWHETHRDVFPIALTYNQLRDRTYQYAAAIKAADSQAQILGPVFTQWSSLFISPNDVQRGDYNTPDDRLAHGNTPLIAWYLQQMKAYEQSNGKRILDYLDLHYYPAAQGVTLGTAGDAATQALRLRSTRALWDTTYVDESWIKDTGIDGGVVKFIPRMREWVANNYPRTKLAISEYNWGAFEHLNGALAQADVLGIFGREGVDLATLWGVPKTTDPVAYAFRLFRNYDGAGGQFGDTSVQANSTNQEALAVYAAEAAAGKALTVMVINKTKTALTAPVALRYFKPNATAQVWQYSAANLQAIQRLADQPVSASGWSGTFPAESITLYRLAGTGITLMRLPRMR